MDINEKQRSTEEKERTDEWLRRLDVDPEKLDSKLLDKFVKDEMRRFESPELFAATLLRILKAGTLISISAFEGLLFLVLNRNFALDDLYQEAYDLLKPTICFSAAGTQLFELINTALSSPYIPKYMLSAFAKRLARLLLWAPADTQLLIMTVMKNMFVAHEGVFEPLVNRKEPMTLDSDPFDNSAKLPDCRAADSSLWELKSTLNHWHIGVSDRSKFIFGGRPDQRVPIKNTNIVEELKRKLKMEKSALNTVVNVKRLNATADLICD
ncbi:hypothetical protein M3Y94_01009800 [Aphelenchoides besseyi]|nr:hypothetical protein M3Y94_01009800 [Aphelenchoides besseyi]KAI6220478.1 Nucleolar complex protein 4-like protein [Aphelenchoides besseyi]